MHLLRLEALPKALSPGLKRSEGYEKAFAGSVYVPVVLKCSECVHLVTSKCCAGC